ncbi:MAG: hypothetical protein K2X93_11695 [Candidatus Obscuribacterales bacterium]|nr:hypothetical protein [Candidatus Obscuribacterales bacterium]
MTASLSQNLLKTMVDWVDLHIGLRVSDARLDDFGKGICLAAADSGFDDPQDYVAELIRTQPKEHELGYLASYLTIGETYFFRDPLSYNLLTAHVLPPLLSKGAPVKIWSAGCATGEEPYSIAITALSAMPTCPIEIVASDINPRYLEVARAGLYRRWSFRDVPTFIKDKYFSLTPDDRYKLSDKIKAMVSFSSLNLASAGYPSALSRTNDVDVIFCRNVLIYFSPQHVTEVLDRFYQCLKDGGYLFLAPTEIPHPAPPNFRLVNFDGAILLRKEGASADSCTVPVSIVQSNFAYFGHSSDMKSFETMIDGDTARRVSDPASLLQKLSAHGHASMEETKLLEPEPIELDDEIDDVVARASHFYYKGEYAEAIDLLLEVSSGCSGRLENPLFLLAKSYANLGNLDAAMDWSERLIGYDPVNARWYYLRATIQQESGEDGAASISLRQAIFLDPEFALAYFALGNIHRQSGDPLQARRCFYQVLDLLRNADGLSEIEDSDGLVAGQLMTIVRTLVEEQI